MREILAARRRRRRLRRHQRDFDWRLMSTTAEGNDMELAPIEKIGLLVGVGLAPDYESAESILMAMGLIPADNPVCLWCRQRIALSRGNWGNWESADPWVDAQGVHWLHFPGPGLAEWHGWQPGEDRMWVIGDEQFALLFPEAATSGQGNPERCPVRQFSSHHEPAPGSEGIAG